MKGETREGAEGQMSKKVTAKVQSSDLHDRCHLYDPESKGMSQPKWNQRPARSRSEWQPKEKQS